MNQHTKPKAIPRWLAMFGMACMLACSAHSEVSGKDRKFRGFMIDAPRGVETLDHYFRLMDFCHSYGINSIIFRLTDDQGSAVRFASHPELKMCDGALSVDELKQLVEYAGRKDIELIPEIESFGHSRYITESKEHQLLGDGPAGEEFNALCPVNPAVIELLEDLYAEVVAVFPGRFFHIGCDEVNWGASEASKKALATASKSQIWAGYVNKLNARVKALGRETLIWADVPIEHDRALLDLLDKDIVLVDWKYSETDKAKVAERANAVLSCGFRLIGCPAASWCGWGPRVGAPQFQNISAFAEVYHELRNPNNLGVIVSNWVPARYFQNSQWDTYAITAEILRHNGKFNYMDAIPRHVEKHFGAQFDREWEMVYRMLYEQTPQWTCGMNNSIRFSPWSSEIELKEILRTNKRVPNEIGELTGSLASCRSRVTKNIADFDDLALTVEFMSYCLDRQNALLEFAGTGHVDETSALAYLGKVSLEDQRMLARIDAAWRRGRRGAPGLIDKPMWAFYNCAAYSKRLSEAAPSEFVAILRRNNP